VTGDEVELASDRGEVGRRSAKEPGKRSMMPTEGVAVEIVILAVRHRRQPRLGPGEAGERLPPALAPHVIPDLIRDPPSWRRWRRKDGSRIKSGVTWKRQGRPCAGGG